MVRGEFGLKGCDEFFPSVLQSPLGSLLFRHSKFLNAQTTVTTFDSSEEKPALQKALFPRCPSTLPTLTAPNFPDERLAKLINTVLYWYLHS